MADIRTYVYGATYDSWNRVQTMTYPDGEVVTYHYNAAGQVERLTSNKQGRQSVIVDRIGYDKEGHTVYAKLGNGTETTYTYDKQRERLQVMNLTADGQTVMENRYRYDAVDNILGITNAANPTSLTKLNKAKLGGRSSHTYEYDELNRLIHANGKAKRASYDMVMSFGRMSEPLTKIQKVDSTTTAKSYNFAYKYEDSNHPTAPTQIGHDHYTYDANGNPTLVTNDSTNTTREMYWDEDNRLMVLSDNGKTSRYTYNATGERIMKSYGTMEGVYINGAPQGITFHETDNFTLYPASILSVNKNRFTKHYFIGDKRVASRIGTGLFNNVYGRNGSYVTAGQQDYAERMNQIQTQKEAYYKKVGVAPGVPTEKGAYGDPENTGVGYNAVLTELGNHDVPQGWIQTPKPNTTPGTNPGPPVSWNDPSNPDDPQAGYGYIPNDTTKEETFFYHSDHLGSTSYITDDKANITQYDAYLPYGELLVDEHSSSEELPYKFNGKQFDEETGLYYYGARYMNPMTSLWYGVDALTEKYPTMAGMIYCMNNPVRLVDPDGNDSYYTKNGDYIGSNNKKSDLIYIVSSYRLIRRLRNGKEFYSFGGKKTLEESDLSAKAYSKIFTNVLKRKGIDTKRLYNGQISVNTERNSWDNTMKKWNKYYEQYNVYDPKNESLSFYPTKGQTGVAISTTLHVNKKIEIVINVYSVGNEEKNYVSTESNIYNMIGIHEFNYHGREEKGNNQHYEILKAQRRDPSWKTTTPQFKSLYKNLERNNAEYQLH